MKNPLFVLVLLLMFSCEDPVIQEPVKNEPEKSNLHAKLGFELDEPEIILNELAKGELNIDVKSVLKRMFWGQSNPAERYWRFKYSNYEGQVREMTYYMPHYAGCEQTKYRFYYNENNLIDSIIERKTNVCLEFDFKTKYTYNYNENGLLKSIYKDNQSFIEENYFSYYPNGKVKEIYNNHRPISDPKYVNDSDYLVKKFCYDSAFNNVTSEEHIGINYHYTYRYFYDEKVNPYKNFFIAVSVFMPYIGPAYISKNNVIKVISKNENNIHGEAFPEEYEFNYSADDKLLNYSEAEKEDNKFNLYIINNEYNSN